jgi:hypothetical protein
VIGAGVVGTQREEVQELLVPLVSACLGGVWLCWCMSGSLVSAPFRWHVVVLGHWVLHQAFQVLVGGGGLRTQREEVQGLLVPLVSVAPCRVRNALLDV